MQKIVKLKKRIQVVLDYKIEVRTVKVISKVHP